MAFLNDDPGTCIVHYHIALLVETDLGQQFVENLPTLSINMVDNDPQTARDCAV